MASVMKILKLMYSSENVGRTVYLVKYFWVKNGVFGDLKAKKCRKPPVFFAGIVNFRLRVGIFDSFDSLHHHPLSGHSPPLIVSAPSCF
jgi:hypothetical protein